MFDRKRLLSALLAAVVAVSSIGVTAFAAEDEDEEKEIIMTFDGLYQMDYTIEPDSLETENEAEIQEKIDAAIRKAANVRKDDDITYGDLAKVKSLNLSGMQLIDVPSCINYMVNLTKLDLSSNLLRSDALKKLSLVGCTKLSNIDLSDNYLTTMPSWFVADRVTSANITQNFVDSSNPRSIEALITTYYLMDGEQLNENNLKNQILKSIRMNNGKPLPEVFFEYNSSAPPYPVGDGKEYPYDLDVVDWKPFTENGKVKASENKTVEVIVRLFNDAENDNTNTTVTIYLLSGKDLPALKMRLTGLKAECDDLKKDEYTESSWTRFTQANDTAKAILDYDNADVQMLKSAFNALVKARDSLQYGTKNLQTMLKGLIKVGDTYKKDNYTPSSWTAFSNALDRLKKVSTDKNASLEAAQSAVKDFQQAQTNLRSAELKVPNKILKSEFEKIFGENNSITSSGITQEGTHYKWTFLGKDLQDVADFNPEVKDTDKNESKILLEAGSISGYRMFATSGNNVLPGKATLELDVSDKFKSGEFYLYKWDTSKNRSKMAGKATVKEGKASIPLTEGGVYYLCRNIQNFELNSSRYQVDNDKKTVTIPPTKGVSANDFKKTFEFGDYTTVLDADGKAVPSSSAMKPGMTINAPNMDKFKVLITGDVDASGKLDFDDVCSVLQVFLDEDAAATAAPGGTGSTGASGATGATGSTGSTVTNKLLYDIDGDGNITFEDVNVILSYFLELN